jgi:hypothetical protein
MTALADETAHESRAASTTTERRRGAPPYHMLRKANTALMRRKFARM